MHDTLEGQITTPGGPPEALQEEDQLMFTKTAARASTALTKAHDRMDELQTRPEEGSESADKVLWTAGVVGIAGIGVAALGAFVKSKLNFGG